MASTAGPRCPPARGTRRGSTAALLELAAARGRRRSPVLAAAPLALGLLAAQPPARLDAGNPTGSLRSEFLRGSVGRFVGMASPPPSTRSIPPADGAVELPIHDLALRLLHLIEDEGQGHLLQDAIAVPGHWEAHCSGPPPQPFLTAIHEAWWALVRLTVDPDQAPVAAEARTHDILPRVRSALASAMGLGWHAAKTPALAPA